jgi:hypothetical protein
VKNPPLASVKTVVKCPYCERHCEFERYSYCDSAIKYLPVSQQQSCSVGRFGQSFISNARADYTAQQKAAVHKALTGDLKYFAGEKSALESFESLEKLLSGKDK